MPENSLIHGCVFKNGLIVPDLHRKLPLLDVGLPKTVGDMRMYMGVLIIFFPAMPKLSNIVSPFEKFCAGKESKTESLKEDFKKFKAAAEHNIKVLALPIPHEQLLSLMQFAETL